jgi:hypothetical protein
VSMSMSIILGSTGRKRLARLLWYPALYGRINRPTQSALCTLHFALPRGLQKEAPPSTGSSRPRPCCCCGGSPAVRPAPTPFAGRADSASPASTALALRPPPAAPLPLSASAAEFAQRRETAALSTACHRRRAARNAAARSMNLPAPHPRPRISTRFIHCFADQARLASFRRRLVFWNHSGGGREGGDGDGGDGLRLRGLRGLGARLRAAARGTARRSRHRRLRCVVRWRCPWRCRAERRVEGEVCQCVVFASPRCPGRTTAAAPQRLFAFLRSSVALALRQMSADAAIPSPRERACPWVRANEKN